MSKLNPAKKRILGEDLSDGGLVITPPHDDKPIDLKKALRAVKKRNSNGTLRS